MYFLAIESSCDETAAAVFDEEPNVLASVVASQTDLHTRFGGVVPEVAARAHVQRLLPVVDEALKKAGITIKDIGAIAVMNTPGLVGALLVGVSAAKMFAVALDVPLIDVNHIEAHIYACRIAAGEEVFPCVGLVVSGGHTSLFHCKSALDFELLGATIDDAAGEAFDKVASMLELGFPGGPAVEWEARSGNPKAFAFPRSFLHERRLDFSFSGLKTAVLYALRDLRGEARVAGHADSHIPAVSSPAGNPCHPLPASVRADVAASFQQAVIDVLVQKCRQALEETGLRTLCVGGGVAANRAFREGLERMAAEQDCRLVIPPLSLCTDNAAMAALAVEKWKAGRFAPLDLDAEPTYAGARRQAVPSGKR
jgi:N6-L-threonylcarbamoyladenine synthase